jgi:hypothetical protein
MGELKHPILFHSLCHKANNHLKLGRGNNVPRLILPEQELQVFGHHHRMKDLPLRLQSGDIGGSGSSKGSVPSFLF